MSHWRFLILMEENSDNHIIYIQRIFYHLLQTITHQTRWSSYSTNICSSLLFIFIFVGLWKFVWFLLHWARRFEIQVWSTHNICLREFWNSTIGFKTFSVWEPQSVINVQLYKYLTHYPKLIIYLLCPKIFLKWTEIINNIFFSIYS